ncbi:MAG: Fic family protein [Kiritimatiellae bacterium]|nr:Fic family protein [Kiritimatiellia bacterium]
MQLIDEILEYLQYHSMSSRLDVERHLSSKVSSATVKRQIARGIEDGLIVSHGNNRSTVYSITPKAHLLRTVNLDSYYAKDMDQRDVQTGYNFDLIRDELPKIDVFSADEKARLDECQNVFTEHMKEMTPGTKAYDRELERLGIDLSWKSAQIEGNTYTLIETETLLKDLKEAKGRTHEEAQMLLNHKSALKAIIANPGYFARLSLARIEDIHAALVENMGVNASLRYRRVRITGTKYQPLDVESQIREAVDDMCALINGKENPYEKALLALLLISYIQPFEDGNKRTSRLVSNALLLAYGHCPLTFRSVDANDYRAALLLFYEQNNISAFKRIFIDQAEFAVHEYF